MTQFLNNIWIALSTENPMLIKILDIPMNVIEKRLFGKWKGKAADKLKRPISMFFSIILVVAIITLVIVAVVPQLRNTFSTLGAKITPFV